MFRIEVEEEGNFLKEQRLAPIENTMKLATGQHLEYIDVVSIKKEPDCAFKGEQGNSLDFEGIKEEVEDDISVQESCTCHGHIETHTLCDESVKQEDPPGHLDNFTASCGESKTQLHKYAGHDFQERDNVSMEKFTEINVHIIDISSNKCIEIIERLMHVYTRRKNSKGEFVKEKRGSCRRREILKGTDTEKWQMRRKQGCYRRREMLKDTNTEK
ncbi:hypothetical protein B7P43_G16115 [Cryptotermes secundus]|uniref:Uncharacterized protein n=1 Tax=Cryptotermes secundus TaxID=105785 RepID=A0A2J7QWY0_9NEOP|nr:uncharacterized protein LOC111864833 isoform X2 [Cryptotermes secundus]PNF33064.1 hypothetical protein B7P43_G16115 [Cryptotermes secundus]